MSGKHKSRAKPPEQKKSREELAEIARENGSKGGRPPGSGSFLPVVQLAALKSMKFRVKSEYKENPEASEIAGLGLERMVAVLLGKVHSRKAPSVLKAAIALREEICEPVVKEQKLSGSLGIASAVAAAAAKINGSGEQT